MRKLLLALTVLTSCSVSAKDNFGEYQYAPPLLVASTQQGNAVALDRIMLVLHLGANVSEGQISQLASTTQSTVLGRVEQANGYVISTDAKNLQELEMYIEHYQKFDGFVDVVLPDVIAQQ